MYKRQNIERAAAFVAEYDQRIFSGDYRYGTDTVDVGLRGFSRIAYRNPTKLVEDSEALQELSGWSWKPVENKRENKSIEIEEQQVPGSLPGSPLKLTAEQAEACDPEHSVVLRASAGSGKTRVLQSRYLGLLLEGMSVEQIVAITFTEKAAREIQSRVENRVQQVLTAEEFEGQALSEEEKSRLAAALNELNKSRIGTIHSFARSIILSLIHI